MRGQINLKTNALDEEDEEPKWVAILKKVYEEAQKAKKEKKHGAQ